MQIFFYFTPTIPTDFEIDPGIKQLGKLQSMGSGYY